MPTENEGHPAQNNKSEIKEPTVENGLKSSARHIVEMIGDIARTRASFDKIAETGSMHGGITPDGRPIHDFIVKARETLGEKQKALSEIIGSNADLRRIASAAGDIEYTGDSNDRFLDMCSRNGGITPDGRPMRDTAVRLAEKLLVMEQELQDMINKLN
jgi:hypothetical protein